MKMKILFVICCFCFVMGTLFAQMEAKTPTKSAAPQTGSGAYNWLYFAGLTCGSGASTSGTSTKPTVQCGGLFGGPWFQFEAGVMGPQAKQSAVSGYISTNTAVPLFSVPTNKAAKGRGLLLGVGGYTRMFETGHALDYGLAYAHPVDSMHSIQFDVRDYWVFSNTAQHNVVLRVSWLVGLPD